MTAPTSTRLPEGLRGQIVAAGFFPDLVLETLETALGGTALEETVLSDEHVIDHLVHHEATFNLESVHRHLSVLILTDKRLLVGHTDESGDNPEREIRAITSVESLSLRKINSVNLTRVVSRPEQFDVDQRVVVETWLTLGWGTMRRIDIEPAHCADPDCVADHGFTGAMVGDDLTVRMSPAADGPESVAQLVRFATALQQVSAL